MEISSYQSYGMGLAVTWCHTLQGDYARGKHGRVIQGSATPSEFINSKDSVFMS